jgi:gamma-glutamyl:cysteine ligase YbdK (ATP-grasp superfamily)
VPANLHPEAIRENRWRAVRHGLDAEFIQPDANGDVVTRSVAETFEATRELVRPVVEKQRL